MDHFSTHGAAFVISITAAGEESRPFKQLPRAPSNDDALKFTSQATCYLSCMSTPPPVALTATPFCVEEMRTITPA